MLNYWGSTGKTALKLEGSSGIKQENGIFVKEKTLVSLFLLVLKNLLLGNIL